MKKFRWGLLGAGVILDGWLYGLRQVEDAEIAGIASRTPETAQAKAKKYGIGEAMSYDEMLRRTDIDAVYIPVPHTAHKELAIRALEAGIPVLVEKPAGVTAADWKEMTDCAERNNVFLMEAVWTRFFPAIQRMKELIAEGIRDKGYQFEIRHVQECIRNGMKESPVVPYDITASVLTQCDILRKQWGLKYPFEK